MSKKFLVFGFIALSFLNMGLDLHSMQSAPVAESAEQPEQKEHKENLELQILVVQEEAKSDIPFVPLEQLFSPENQKKLTAYDQSVLTTIVSELNAEQNHAYRALAAYRGKQFLKKFDKDARQARRANKHEDGDNYDSAHDSEDSDDSQEESGVTSLECSDDSDRAQYRHYSVMPEEQRRNEERIARLESACLVVIKHKMYMYNQAKRQALDQELTDTCESKTLCFYMTGIIIAIWGTAMGLSIGLNKACYR